MLIGKNEAIYRGVIFGHALGLDGAAAAVCRYEITGPSLVDAEDCGRSG